MATKGLSELTWTAPPKGVKFNNTSGKNPNAPMVGRGALVNIGKRQTGDAQKQALAETARDALPPAPPGGKINIAA